jgi:hypothetical protein
LENRGSPCPVCGRLFVQVVWLGPVGAQTPAGAVFEEYPDPKERKVKLDGDNAVEFHRLPEMQQVTLKVLRWEERDKRFLIKEAEMVA